MLLCVRNRASITAQAAKEKLKETPSAHACKPVFLGIAVLLGSSAIPQDGDFKGEDQCLLALRQLCWPLHDPIALVGSGLCDWDRYLKPTTEMSFGQLPARKALRAGPGALGYRLAVAIGEATPPSDTHAVLS
jgi:hypothetical protein